MAPHPMKEDQTFQERKEELMIAKQLRQSRVTILPRMSNSPNFLNPSPYSSKSSSPSPNILKKKLSAEANARIEEDLPKNWSPGSKDTWQSKFQGPTKKDVEAASNPIALRYWNQCLSKAAHAEIAIPEITTQAPDADTSWQESPPWALTDPECLTPNEACMRKESVDEKKCSIKVPDIKRHMNKLDKSKPSGCKPWSGNPGKQVNKSWVETARSNHNSDNPTCNGKTLTHIKTHQWSDSLVQRSENISETTRELPTFEISEAHDDPSPLIERKNSITKPKITRNNEVKEAAQNIGRFITIDKIDKNEKPKKSLPAPKTNGTMETMHELKSHQKTSETNHNQSKTEAPPLPPKSSKQLNNSHEKAEVFVTPPETRQNSPGEEYQKKSMSQSDREIEKQLNKVNIPQESSMHMKPAKQKCDKNDKEASGETKKRLSGIPKSLGKDDNSIQLDATSDMSALAEMLLPQLNSMQKNHLGLVFFNQLSNNIVEDILIQQLTVMSGAKLTNALNNVDVKVLEHVIPKLMPLLKQDILVATMGIWMNSLKLEEKVQVVVDNGEEEDTLEVCSKLMAVMEKKKKHELIKAAIKNEDDDDLIEELFKDYLKRKNISDPDTTKPDHERDVNETDDVIEDKDIPEINNIKKKKEPVNLNDTIDDVTEIESEEGEDMQDMDDNKEVSKEDQEKSDEESWEWEEDYDDESYSVETFNGEFSVALVN